ncbi:probable cysteine--tRNA ligase, mitochondrial [Haliotis cracherodii]|uniref:probable cysteine--tRNA ligase, mitochondrial n=1 Tax=Haliotis cracherodii TaxID=6455 RepID=UPI0039ECF4F8
MSTKMFTRFSRGWLQYFNSSHVRFPNGNCQVRVWTLTNGTALSSSFSTSQRYTNWEQPQGHDTGIKVWNSLTKTKEPLILRNDRIGTWYMCGPTVYDSAHIGHASTYMRFDIIRRIMENFFDINLMVVLGITDIDDKIINRSKETGIPFTQITWQHKIEFFEDMEALNILPPSRSTQVTEYVPEIIDFVNEIMDKGYAYTTPSGSVYFDVEKFGRYGILCPPSGNSDHWHPDNQEKKNAADFALWKAAKPGEPHWEAPWGRGRPGWHVECSTMASEVFGNKMDIHSGGTDLMFPHHENELAQSHAYHGCTQWANYWIHTGHLYLKGDSEKMSKSLKNVITISELLEKYTANQFRVLCLLTPYRNNIEYTDEKMQKAMQLTKQIQSCLHQCQAYVRGQLLTQPINEAKLHKSLSEARSNIEAALADDFNTAQVMESVMDLVKHLNIALGTKVETAMGARSPAVVSHSSTYLQNVMAKLGVSLQLAEPPAQDLTTRRFQHIMDSVVDFRAKVRNFSIDPPEEIIVKDADPSLTEKRARRKVLSPLLQACDVVRDDLKAAKVQILDHGKTSSWTLTSDDDGDKSD